MYTLIGVFLLFSFLGRSQDHIQFKNYSISDGLSQSSVSCVVQDQLGALWIGTQDGINRFNGKNFEVFTAHKGYDISNGYINTAYIDANNNIWFGTYDGLTRYDPKNVRFTAYKSPSGRQIDITAIKEDRKNARLWLGTSYGRIYSFDFATQQFTLWDDTSFSSKIIGIKEIGKTLVFVSQLEGVLTTDNQLKTSKHIDFLQDVNDKKEIEITCDITFSQQDLLLATTQGIYKYTPKQNHLIPISGLLSQLKNVAITDVLFLSPTRAFVTSENSGLFQLKTINDSLIITNHVANVFQQGSLSSNRLTGIFEDNQGVIWITSERGLSSFNPNFIGFRGVGISADPTQGLTSQNVWGFEESSTGRYLYIATDNGVTRYDRETHQFAHFYRKSSNSNEEYTSLCLYVINDDKILVGGVDGLYLLMIDSLASETYHYRKLKSQQIDLQYGFDLIYSIIPYKNQQQFLLGTKAGIALYDLETKKYEYLSYQPNNQNTIGPGACRFVFETNGKYYTSPASGGIYEIKEEHGKLYGYQHNAFTPLSQVSSNYFSDMLQTDTYTFWLATMGDGLLQYNTKTQKITAINQSKGLPNNVIYGVEATKNNPKYIWLTTNKGVVAYDINTRLSYVFTTKDGLMSNELNQGASFLSQSGNIYFGGIKGYNFVNPKEAFYTNENLKVYFSGISVENRPIFPKEGGILSQSIAFTKEITLSYSERSLKLKFFANDLTNPDRIEYKYVINGGDDGEEILGTHNVLRLTSIAPGTYEIYIYARVINGEWNHHPAHLIVHIQRPFWMTWWFYMLIAIGIAIYGFYRVRKRIDESRRRQIRLEMKISERTRELRKKTEFIEHQKTELQKEKEKSEQLLNNVLPVDTATQLKKGGQSTARDFKKVSIMFTDFVGFSKRAEDMTAQELVHILDRHFRKFDAIIDKFNLEKIKTIGDAYMCAGGVPIRDKTNPISTALAAIQIKYYMLAYKQEQLAQGKRYWELRIGINTGPVSAGVIGTKRYAYDVWGSTVNRAQRMERFCEPGQVRISQDTFEEIEPYFECREIGMVGMKSGLEIMTYELICIKPELSLDGMGIEPNGAFIKLVELHHYSKINYQNAERFIINKLERELNPNLHYHSYLHSKDVTRQAERIAIEEGITDEDLFLLKSAASYHDAGFVKQYEHNESIGATMAEEILPKFGYTEEHIQRIKELIFVTEVPHRPQNILEEIICDADLDYLGRDDFFEISDRLRKELREFGKLNSDRTWDEMQVKFFIMHRYFTQTAIRTRKKKKMQHLAMIKKRLAENKYKD